MEQEPQPIPTDLRDDVLEALALEGLNSGEPFEPGPNYWTDKHRRLAERLKVRT